MHEAKQRKNSYIIKGLFIFIAILLIAILLKWALTLSVKKVVFFFGENLKEDSYGHTNILVLGVGGEAHENKGPDLTDSMMIVSIDGKTKNIAMMSIPRDIYVDVRNIGKEKINAVYSFAKKYYKDNSAEGLEAIREVVQEIYGIPVQYYVKIDFKGFAKLIDSVDGIDVFVDQTLDDPFFPKGQTNGMEHLIIPAGLQHFDGITALKYARSRETTSIFDRDKRQQKVIMALKNKLIKEGKINEADIEDLYLMLKDNVETNMGIREIIRLAEVGSDIKEANMKTYELNDDPSLCGGWLYPGERSSFNNAYVLIPATHKGVAVYDDYEYVQRMTNFVMNNSKFMQTPYKIQLLNGTKTSGIAASLTSMLHRYCLNVIKYGNGKDQTIQNTTYYLKNNVDPDFVYLLQRIIPGKASTTIPQEYLSGELVSDADVIIEIGSDYLGHPVMDPQSTSYAIQARTRPTSTVTTPTTVQPTTK